MRKYWLPSYTKTVTSVLDIFKIAGLILDKPRMQIHMCESNTWAFLIWVGMNPLPTDQPISKPMIGHISRNSNCESEKEAVKNMLKSQGLHCIYIMSETVGKRNERRKEKHIPP